MAITLLKSVNFGIGKSELDTVGVTLIDTAGNVSVARSTVDIHEVGTSTGIYAVPITFVTNFIGSILWDTGDANTVYASEEYNGTEENVSFIKDIEGGKWSIDTDANQMIFYKSDNVTEVARFNLKDSSGNADSTNVFTRLRA
jgi:hypothetical protein